MFPPIPIEEFKRRTEISGATELLHNWEGASCVTSLRDLREITAIQIMSKEYLKKLLRHVVLEGGNKGRVYEGCEFHIMEVSPRAARLGQTFVENKKCLGFLGEFRNLLNSFCSPGGVTKSGAFVALGKTADGSTAIAHYLPPIMEMNGGKMWALLDGVHRNYMVDAMGGTTSVIAVEGVSEPFPCRLHDWSDVRAVDQKPPREERFFDLKPELFRNLKHVGIDG